MQAKSELNVSRFKNIDFGGIAYERCAGVFTDAKRENDRRALVSADNITIMGVAVAVAYELQRGLNLTAPVETLEADVRQESFLEQGFNFAGKTLFSGASDLVSAQEKVLTPESDEVLVFDGADEAYIDAALEDAPSVRASDDMIYA